VRQQRITPILAALLIGFLLVGLRLVELQGMESDMWLRESERSTVRLVTLPFERGWVLDRHGQPLARTQEVRDLVFRFREWRRTTAAGQASHAWVTLGAPRLPVADAVARAGELAADLGALRVDEIAALEPRQRRRDLGYYLEELFGARLWDAVVEHLQAEPVEPVPLAGLPGFAEGLQRCRERAEAERLALADLSDVAGLERGELLDGMERAAARADQRVAAGLLREPQDERDLYRRSQQLRAEFDADPARLQAGVSYDTRTLVAIRGAELGGLDIQVEMRRVYPDESRDVAPMIVGRVGAPQPEDMELAVERRLRLADLSSLTSLDPVELDELERLRIQVREIDYTAGEERGLLGVESALEQVLRGKRGWIATSELVDSERVERQDPRRGLDVRLSLDLVLQRAAEEVLAANFEHSPPVLGEDGLPVPDVPPQWSGAIVLLDVPTGQVLVLASGPQPTREQLDEQYGWLLTSDPWMRLRHRGLDPGRSGNLPPPGSTFKPIAALAGLTAAGHLITPGTRFLCEGSLAVGERTMGCLGTHGEIDLAGALARSCNIYFYRLGRTIGVEPLAEMAQRFGLGTGQRSGLLGGNEVLEALGVPVASGVHESAPTLGAGDSVTDAMRLAIGQAPLDDVTALQVASMMAALGSGVFRLPTLVTAIEAYPPIAARAARDLDLPGPALAAVRDGLAGVIDSEAGTGRHLQAWLVEHLPDLVGQIAAKTGTAQVGGGKDQAWFAGYLPRRAPRVAFAVLVEDCGLHGAEAAVPVFEQLLAHPEVAAFLRDEALGRPRPTEIVR